MHHVDSIPRSRVLFPSLAIRRSDVMAGMHTKHRRSISDVKFYGRFVSSNQSSRIFQRDAKYRGFQVTGSEFCVLNPNLRVAEFRNVVLRYT